VLVRFARLASLRSLASLRYEGDFADGMFSGHGVLFAPPEGGARVPTKMKKEYAMYIGGMKRGLKDGHGIENDPVEKRKIYDGGFKEGERHGYGVSELASGYKYVRGRGHGRALPSLA
jgi:hypothetical protein